MLTPAMLTPAMLTPAMLTPAMLTPAMLSPTRLAPQRLTRPLARTLTTTRPRRTLKVDQDRLMADIHHTAQWGTGTRWGDHETETGMSRLALSDADKAARDWFGATAEALGCRVTVDAMGNQFAVRPGRRAGAPTFAGSHLDTQPAGGRYDGVLGVAAGIEMLRVLADARHETRFPVGVVNWTNEEGARFPISMVASGVWAGAIPLARAHGLASVVPGESGVTMGSELARIGYLGDTECSSAATPMAAHFELHIEQGPALEAANARVGVVHGVQAYRWFTVTVRGRAAHTGATGLAKRADALLAAAKMIVASREAAWQEGGLASTGIIEALPGSTNTVPGEVRFSLDLRAKDDATLKRLERRLRETFAFIASGKSALEVFGAKAMHAPEDFVKVQWVQDSDSKATHFDERCIKCVEEATSEVLGDRLEKERLHMRSGAGHDTVYASHRVPASMIFVPCRDGVSHNPTEFTKPEDCAIGAQVLLGAVLKFDQARTE